MGDALHFVSRRTVVIKDGKRVEYSNNDGRRGSGLSTVVPGDFPSRASPHTPLILLTLDHLVSARDVPEKRLTLQPSEKISGHDCVVLDFKLGRDASKDHEETITYRFWIDLARG